MTEEGQMPITGVSVILVPGEEVEMVEFLEMKTGEDSQE